jgi:hypothetical protein
MVEYPRNRGALYQSTYCSHFPWYSESSLPVCAGCSGNDAKSIHRRSIAHLLRWTEAAIDMVFPGTFIDLPRSTLMTSRRAAHDIGESGSWFRLRPRPRAKGRLALGHGPARAHGEGHEKAEGDGRDGEDSEDEGEISVHGSINGPIAVYARRVVVVAHDPQQFGRQRRPTAAIAENPAKNARSAGVPVPIPDTLVRAIR